MSKQQLYINGVAVDMPAEEIKIKVESNFFSDVGKIKTAHSYTAALPRTLKNDAIFALAYVVGADTGGVSTHRYLDASLFVDGVPLFQGGRAVLTSVDDKGYNVSLYWGLLGIFDEIKAEGLDLCDLPMSARWTVFLEKWVTLYQYNNDEGGIQLIPPYVGGMTEEIYNTLDADGQALADAKPWTSPYVTAEEILAKISRLYDITFDYSPAFSARVATLYHPLTTLRTMAKDEKMTGQFLGDIVDVPNVEHTLYWGAATASNTHIKQNVLKWGDSGSDEDFNVDSSFPAFFYTPKSGGVTYESLHIKGVATKPWSVYFHDEWKDACEGGTPQLFSQATRMWRVEATLRQDGAYELDITFKNVTAGAGVMIPTPITDQSWPWADTPEATVTGDYVISGCDNDIVERGGQFSFDRNYPSMKVLDYLGEVLAHCGAFIAGSVTRPDAVRFVTFDEVLSQTPRAIDTQGVESIDMTLNSFARSNIYKHKENDEGGVPYSASGNIVVRDETLKLERTAFDSKFKVPRTNVIRQWEISANEDGHTYSARWKDAGDWIAGWRTYGLYNTGQDFATILDSYYNGYKGIVRRPKSVDAVVRLGVLDLLALDLARPVYVAQLAASFIVIEIDSDGGDQYTLKLAKI